MKLYLEVDEKQYEKLKKQLLDGYRMKRVMRFHPVYISQRKFMKELQDKGYNDIFIPNMKKLSPDYKKYHDALTAMNQRRAIASQFFHRHRYAMDGFRTPLVRQTIGLKRDRMWLEIFQRLRSVFRLENMIV